MAASITFRPTPGLEAKLATSVGIQRLLTAIVLHIEREAKRRSPYITGNLRRSIGHQIISENGQPVGIVAATAFYAAFVEFGTRRKGPRPYLRPALATIENYLGGLT